MIRTTLSRDGPRLIVALSTRSPMLKCRAFTVEGCRPAIIRFSWGHLEGAHHVEVELKHGAVMGSDAAAQGFDEVCALLAGRALGELRQPPGAASPAISAPSMADPGAQDIREAAGDFDVGILQGLLDPEQMLRDFPHELLAGPRQVAQFLD